MPFIGVCHLAKNNFTPLLSFRCQICRMFLKFLSAKSAQFKVDLVPPWKKLGCKIIQNGTLIKKFWVFGQIIVPWEVFMAQSGREQQNLHWWQSSLSLLQKELRLQFGQLIVMRCFSWCKLAMNTTQQNLHHPLLKNNWHHMFLKCSSKNKWLIL
jgi:hypothetical protein